MLGPESELSVLVRILCFGQKCVEAICFSEAYLNPPDILWNWRGIGGLTIEEVKVGDPTWFSVFPTLVLTKVLCIHQCFNSWILLLIYGVDCAGSDHSLTCQFNPLWSLRREFFGNFSSHVHCSVLK